METSVNRIACDFETTGLNVYNDEILTGFFINLENNESYDFRSKVNNYKEDSYKIHKISITEMESYPNKKVAFDKLLKWLPKSFELICYANENTELGKIIFDYAILKMEIMDHLEIYHEAQLPVSFKALSVHTMAKECAKKGLFKPIKGKKNRDSFKQADVYYALFDDRYEEHNAKADVIAMKRIYDELEFRKNNNFGRLI